MAQITAALVKELREITGAGMMDCKKALVECDGDKDKAIDYLREKGISKAAKKAGRIASEGVVAAAFDKETNTACLVEVNSETDFVAKNDNFKALVKKIAEHIIATKPADLDALNASMLDGKTVADVMTEAVASIGEKLSLRRFVVYTSDKKLATYIHMGGKIGVVVELSGGSDELAQDIRFRLPPRSHRALTVVVLIQNILTMSVLCCGHRLWKRASQKTLLIRWLRDVSIKPIKRFAWLSRNSSNLLTTRPFRISWVMLKFFALPGLRWARVLKRKMKILQLRLQPRLNN